jgi:quercetin dioxygenase-like cupin family protein
MENKYIFDEVNEKIGRIKQKFSVKMDWVENNEELIEVSTDSWQNVDNIAEGGKLMAIEEVIPNTPSNSVIFYAPKGAIINTHSHPQLEFCICLSGKLKFITNKNELYILEPIESIYVKPNDIHFVEFIEDSQIIVTWFPKMGF